MYAWGPLFLTHVAPLLFTLYWLSQTGDDIESILKNTLNEPNLVVFCDDDNTIKQMLLCAEHQVTYELSSTRLIDDIVHLMAMFEAFIFHEFRESTVHP